MWRGDIINKLEMTYNVKWEKKWYRREMCIYIYINIYIYIYI